jgi:hypothetical protein
MHVTAVLDAIKKCGHFLDYKKAEKAQDEAKKNVESARAGLSLLDGTRAKSRWFCKKKAKEAAKKTLPKAQDSKPEAKEDEEGKEDEEEYFSEQDRSASNPESNNQQKNQ